jgi:hypothetical protein
MPITLLPEKFDVSELLSIYNSIDITSQQIYITSLNGKTYSYDSMEMKKYMAEGKAYLLNDMIIINELFKDSYLEDVYNEVKKKYDVCRARFLKLDPRIRAYSYHKDQSERYHIPLTTDNDSMLLIEDNVYRLSEIGALYKVDTLQKHTAMNLGWNDRIHIVFDKRI